ncbi:EF-hand domain-containing protein [Caballeronia sp. 15715]|uniref:EF-hand domain-containing protein n=1 Tax=Caballeronia sp. 15715 TaxID=3391030 RepID=UPI0039E258F1
MTIDNLSILPDALEESSQRCSPKENPVSISALGNSPGFNADSNTSAAKSQLAASDPGSNSSSTSGSSSSSTVVTLSNGRSSVVTELSETLVATPLAVAWAPQLFVQADTDNDNKLTGSEFVNLMKRAGMATDAAQALFQSFDVSKDGTLSMSEFVQGVAADQASGSTVFDKVIDSYAVSQNGESNPQSMQSFLSAGQGAAEQYWALRR